MEPFYLKAKTISDAWFQLIYNIFDNSYTQQIQRGSFEKEQYRLQYPGIAVFIEHPSEDIVPIIPPALGIPAPTSMEYIENYFANYLMDPALSENETYKYSSRIHHPMPQGGSQLDRAISMLRETPLTNQAVIEIGTPEDYDTCFGKDGKLDPPCLRLLDFKAIPSNKTMLLTVTAYFRSWDLWAGFPSNLGGIELLKQYVAAETEMTSGPIYAYSAGAHIYGYQEELARLRTLRVQKR
ncbi:MAG TPA: thymidylate synthase [Dissulfurispiraceae bacterium]|nr:thymidylate synthase [Dissulfurispiraceae bacterium]